MTSIGIVSEFIQDFDDVVGLRFHNIKVNGKYVNRIKNRWYSGGIQVVLNGKHKFWGFLEVSPKKV